MTYEYNEMKTVADLDLAMDSVEDDDDTWVRRGAGFPEAWEKYVFTLFLIFLIWTDGVPSLVLQTVPKHIHNAQRSHLTARQIFG